MVCISPRFKVWAGLETTDCVCQNTKTCPGGSFHDVFLKQSIRTDIVARAPQSNLLSRHRKMSSHRVMGIQMLSASSVEALEVLRYSSRHGRRVHSWSQNPPRPGSSRTTGTQFVKAVARCIHLFFTLHKKPHYLSKDESDNFRAGPFVEITMHPLWAGLKSTASLSTNGSV